MRSIKLIATAGLVFGAIAIATAADSEPGTPAAPQQKLVAPKDLGKVKSLSIFSGTEKADSIKLRGSDARQQIIVTAQHETGERDVTRTVKYDASPANVVSVNANGLVTATGNGSATITAKSSDGASASVSVTVEQFETSLPINFPNRVVPIFTKAGCNSGGCHGKSGGQNGFRLSLLGFEPTEDFEHLVKESRGRRMFPASPERSLLLTKAIGAIPHGGGKRLEPTSDDYRLIVRWIGQGMPYGKPEDPTVSRIEVFPKQRIMGRGGDQQLAVTAFYSDGSTEDVTRSALYEPNDQEMAKVDVGGFVAINQQPGDVAVMVRYQARVAVFRATVPLGAPVENLPKPRNFVDELVFKKLQSVGMPPSAEANDATFLRRVTVDIAGRLPTPEEAEQFFADKSADKRDKLIDRLLDSPAYADYFANKWSALLRNKRTTPTQAKNTYTFHDWVRDSLAVNKPYDQFVRDVLTASGDTEINPPVGWYKQVKETSGQLEDTAQLFLGMRLQCAQCHHHPFEKWSQQDYFSFSAFFSRVGRKANPGGGQNDEVIFHKRGDASATNPKTKQTVKPAGLGSEQLSPSADEDPRVLLADWMTKKTNPFFAKSFANRYWKHFMGRGLVEPEDDMRETNPPTNPELLEALAKNFVESGFDMKQFVRTICQSKTYQLDSLPNEYNKIDKQNYSRYYPKRLQAEVLLDSVTALTGSDNKFDGLPTGYRAVQLPDNGFNATSYFLTVFGRPDSSSACECERSMEPSLAQSLHLLNAKDLQDKIASGGGRAAKMAADKNKPDEQKIRELYLWAYCREPDQSELAAAKGYIERITSQADAKKPDAARNRAYEDIVWALLNTKEFSFNH